MAALENLEKLRQNLEKQIAQLKTSLQYWQTWEYEHEGFKDELENLENEPDTAAMLAVGQDLELEIVNDKEIKEILNHGKKPTRSRTQVLTQLRGRIDTGQRNAATIQRQLQATETKLDKVLIVAEPASDTQDGEQLMDIMEQLDDDGNVVASEVKSAAEGHKGLTEVLTKNGLLEKEKEKEQQVVKDRAPDDLTVPRATRQKVGSQPDAKTKKVGFAAQPEIWTRDSASPTTSQAPLPNQMHPSQRMLVVNEHDDVIDSKPLELVHPIGSDETVNHYREAYAIGREIAPIVASLDIEEETDTDSGDTGSELSEWENDYGMGDTGAELTDDYKAQMERLMAKHAVAMENAGPDFNGDVMEKLKTAHRDAGLQPVQAQHAGREAVSEKTSNKHKRGKGVRFAEEVDVSSPPTTINNAAKMGKAVSEDEDGENPISETVLERSSSTNKRMPSSSTPRKPSRFKTSMNTASNKSPEDPTDTSTDNSSVKIEHAAAPPVIPRDEQLLPERPKKMSKFKTAQMSVS